MRRSRRCCDREPPGRGDEGLTRRAAPPESGSGALSYVLIHRFRGGTQAQYEAALAAVHPPGGLPEGQLHHLAGPTDGGWAIVAVHDSRESRERFRDGTLKAEEKVNGSLAQGAPA